MKHVIVPIAHGFEEIEAIVIIDILRRAGIQVAAVGVGERSIQGSHDITIECDAEISALPDGPVDAVVLPGGLPGTRNLAASDAVRRLVRETHRRDAVVAAICAAPLVLAAEGVTDGRRATSHPAHENEMTGCTYQRDRVVRDGNVITSRGAGTAVEFAAEIVARLVGREVAHSILAAIVAPESKFTETCPPPEPRARATD